LLSEQSQFTVLSTSYFISFTNISQPSFHPRNHESTIYTSTTFHFPTVATVFHSPINHKHRRNFPFAQPIGAITNTANHNLPFADNPQPANQRLNMELDLQYLYGLLCTAVLIGCHPSPPPHLASYTRSLLVSQARRHLFVTPCSQSSGHILSNTRSSYMRNRFQIPATRSLGLQTNKSHPLSKYF
jgi:hypothetical protein